MTQQNIGTTYVPNKGPFDAKIAIVGEAPGEEEERHREPFWPDAPAGARLNRVLQRNGLVRDQVRLLNLSNYRPRGNFFPTLLKSTALETGLEELKQDLLKQKPNVICALGNWPLWFLTGKKNKNPGSGIGNWRGSILNCNIPGLEGTKVIPTFHPAYIARNPAYYAVFDQDMKRVIEDSTFKELKLPQRKMVIDPKNDLEEWVKLLCDSEFVAVDIEGVKKSTKIMCIGFAPSPDLCICLVYRPNDFATRNAIESILQSKAGKIFHNGQCYDEIMLRLNGYNKINNYVWDTQTAQHAMWIELPKSLAFLTSIYTREPYYKDEGKEEDLGDVKSWSEKMDRTRLYKYNCKDVGVTIEIAEKQRAEVQDGPKGWKRVFTFEHTYLRDVAQDMGMYGMLRDIERHKQLKAIILTQWMALQLQLDKLAGRGINVNSGPNVQGLLYDELGLKEHKKRNNKGQWSRTTDDAALVSLIGDCKQTIGLRKTKSTKEKWTKNLNICKLIRLIRRLRKLLSSYININISDDNRVRSIYKIPTDTGRSSCSIFVDGTGLNAQTLPRDPIEIVESLEGVVKEPEKYLGLELLLNRGKK